MVVSNLDKNSPEANTCYNKNYNNIFQGFNYQTKDTFFFTFIIQFILVSIMYIHVGKGRYWKVLFYASVAGLIGAFIEHSTLAYICQTKKHDKHTKVVPFFVEEFFWIICEYAVPYLNLIKMEAISNGKMVKTIRILILILLIPFSAARLYDGYDRMIQGYLNTNMSRKCHGVAFGTMAAADVLCTVFIIYFVRNKNRKGTLNNNSISSYIKNSSYTILICVDMVSFLLSILYILSSIIFPENENLGSSTTIFHCLKSVFILILATDALIFKFGVNSNSTTNQSSGNNSRGRTYSSGYKRSNISNINNPNYTIDMTNNYKTGGGSQLASITPYNYPSVDHEHFNKTNKDPTVFANNKTIIKNYTDIQPSSIEETKDYQSAPFGFLYQSSDYTDLIYKGEGKKIKK